MYDNTGQFVTLTFSNHALIKLMKMTGYTESNALAKQAVRWFLERWRKKYKKSVKHWLITELGHENTERIHLHGILFTKENNDTIQSIWQYGKIDIGYSMNTKVINYMIKYVSKIDQQHKNFKPQIMTSPGIGKNYIDKKESRDNLYKGDQTNEGYRYKSGHKSSLPIYYRNKLYNDEQKQILWLNKLRQKKRFILGQEIDISTDDGLDRYYRLLEDAQAKNKRTDRDWETLFLS